MTLVVVFMFVSDNSLKDVFGALSLHDAVDPLVVSAKERERGQNILLATKIEAHPSRVRDTVVRRRFATGNEFVAHGARKRQIGYSAAMKVAEFQFANAKFASAEAMLSHYGIWPP